MRAYVFRLEGVARVRRVEALLARRRVGDAARALTAATARERADHDRYEASTAGLGELEAEAFAALRERAARLAVVLLTAAETRARLESRLLGARNTAATAERRVAVLERIDERRRREWRDAAQREDTAVLDDLATVRAAFRAGRALDVD